MTAYKSTSFLDALHLKNHSGKPPIWLMRQAGRYLPEYRALRASYSFLEMVKNPKIACEVTTQPIRRFQFDAAILFSDILMLPEALGMHLQFKEKIGPIFRDPLKTKSDVHALKRGNISSLECVKETIGLINQKLDVPLIGFAGAPFTVASYMIEGGSSKTLAKTKAWVVNEEALFLELMEFITEKTIEYLEMQVDAGASAIQLFDTWAGLLSNRQFKEVSLPYLKRIVASISKKVPVILFSKAASAFTEEFKEAMPQGISFDINADLSKKRKELPHMVLQGNFDPDILLASPDVIRKEARKILHAMNGDPGFIFNLGHGIHKETSIDAVHALIDEVRK